jgi:hypothetical protein
MFTRSILPVFFFALAACSDATKDPAPTPAPSITLPVSMKLDVAPPAAESVIDARKDADGSDVVVTGRVRDFIATRSVFTIADLSIRSCAEPDSPMGDCKTPWDYCCADPKALAAGTATIELHDGDKPAMGSAQGWNGLDHLKQVVVKGKIKKDATGNLAVIASGIFVKP